MIQSEKQLSTKATTDSFDEIYTNYDLSVNDIYSADTGYPFDYPTRWLNDPSMNKRIAIRRLDVTPSSHQFTITLSAEPLDKGTILITDTFPVTPGNNLIEVLDHMCRTFKYNLTENGAEGGLRYEYNVNQNKLTLWFEDTSGNNVDFSILNGKGDSTGVNIDLTELLRFLNQPEDIDNYNTLTDVNELKIFTGVWSRDRIHFHASFSTSRRHFIGKRGDFYQNLTLLYPPPTNESTFFIRFTSNGIKNILLRYCEFDVQLCYIVNYKKATIL